ncbi:hypothetical protein ABE525_25435 [Pseudomonas wadenswilerensis]|uniref:hypothetical protein n=1 Tax=Pseudomonas TaxID=286 RepID=UPI00100C98C7|nr:hypothetical protein [Pseudomonas sp. JV241A]SPO66393.1 conserved protein of unknown function [Pseudomonas sp. JV241A]
MNTPQWLALFERAFRNMEKKLEQVVQLNSCREHWIQAEISLHAWFEDGIEIWTELPIGDRRKADLYALDDNGAPAMVAEIKCLGDVSQTKCLEGDWSVRADVDRLRSFECPTRLFVLVIAKGERETTTGRRLREDEWVDGRECVSVDLEFALVRMWAL